MSSPIDGLIDSIVKPVMGAKDDGSGLPFVTHEGILNLAGIELPCVVLNDGRRLIIGPLADAFAKLCEDNK